MVLKAPLITVAAFGRKATILSVMCAAAQPSISRHQFCGCGTLSIERTAGCH
jgi:hypothetical protein